ncbi:Hint domain-containing protein [Paracoccus laeviglucosivorans]|uniref:Hint domain-containing protein n=1 Tax=Paracoccus laeviglucosivorans TaxID=1197861 RepID=A0A521BYM3_9RHOB|nr:Hint domain-containing protein [Paracoccus laeviglucosivorans]SMO52292.1 Hint domain-containing protein [Paracoccus laeviglucosivorans]
MPYYTQIPSNLLTIGVDGGVAFVPNTNLLNAFGNSQEFAQYDVASNIGPTTLTNGSQMQLVDSSGNPVTADGTYVGSATVSNAAAGVNIPGVAQIGLQVNPISGHIMQAGGNYYFISENPLDDAHINVTANATVLGVPISVTAPISNITGSLASAISTGVPVVGPTLATTVNATGNLLQSTANTAIVTMNNNTSGSLTLDADDVFCFVTGTLIETDRGMVAVEDLAVGDLVMTRDNGLKPILWLGAIKLGKGALMAQPKLRPIRIRAGALGDNMPSADLLVSPQHRVLVRSKVAMKMFGAMEVLVAAKQLLQIDGIDIAHDMAEVEYFHFLFDQHEVVNSNGAATESLFTGPEALKSVGREARAEICALFPEILKADFIPVPARPIPAGRRSRKLAVRHAQRPSALVN